MSGAAVSMQVLVIGTGFSGVCAVLKAARAGASRLQQKTPREMGRTVWATGCKSWYKRADGRIETLYPGNARAYAHEMRDLKTNELIVNG